VQSIQKEIPLTFSLVKRYAKSAKRYFKKALAFSFVARPRVKTIDKNQLIQKRFKVEKRKQNAGKPPNNTNKIPEQHRGTGSLIH
jgi:hypothetical protein